MNRKCFNSSFCRKDFFLNLSFAYLIILYPPLLFIDAIVVIIFIQEKDYSISLIITLCLFLLLFHFLPFILAFFKLFSIVEERYKRDKICVNYNNVIIYHDMDITKIQFDNIKSVCKKNNILTSMPEIEALL